MENFNCFSDEINNLPPEIHFALTTNRKEFLNAFDYRVLDQQEFKSVIKLLGILIDTNQALREHSIELGKLMDQVQGSLLSLEVSCSKLSNKAHFRNT